jgi:hypothetical protein
MIPEIVTAITRPCIACSARRFCLAVPSNQTDKLPSGRYGRNRQELAETEQG